jgi:Mn-dependent DtxR family transcriptional regulator
MTEATTVTSGAIAKELGVSEGKVKKAIEKLGLEPVAKRGVCRLYAPEAVEAVKNALA